jgi:hypothetical protein
MQAHTVNELMHLATSAGFAGDLPTPHSAYKPEHGSPDGR